MFVAALSGFASVAIASTSLSAGSETPLQPSPNLSEISVPERPNPAEPNHRSHRRILEQPARWSKDRQSMEYTHRSITGTVDLELLCGPRGSNLVAQILWVKNQDQEFGLDALTGAFNSVSNLYARDQLRVFYLYYRQSWRADAYVVKVGQLAADSDFMGSGGAA
jgi:hypothetical protein